MVYEDLQLESFRKWCVQHEVNFDGFQLKRTADKGIGVFATREIASDSVALSVPVELALTVAQAVRSNTAKAALSSKALNGEPVSAQAIMYLVMIDGRSRSDSFWNPWLRMLPDTFADPLWWSGEARARLLAGTQLAYDTVRHESQLRDVFNGIFPALSEELPDMFPSSRFTFQAFLWARSALSSRSFSLAALGENPPAQITLAPEEQTRIRNDCPAFMCPLLDFTNHKPRAKLHVGLTQTSAPSVDFRVHETVLAGGEVFNNYGDCRSNLQLLLGYGFSIPGNPADEVPIKLGGPPLSSLPLAKRGAFQRSGLQFGDTYTLSGTTPLPSKMLAVMRILLMSDKELNAMGDKAGVGPLKVAAREAEDSTTELGRNAFLDLLCISLPPRRKSAGVELTVLDTVKQQLVHKLKAVEAVQLDSQGSPAEKNAAGYREGQTAVLRAALAAVNQAKSAWREKHQVPDVNSVIEETRPENDTTDSPQKRLRT